MEITVTFSAETVELLRLTMLRFLGENQATLAAALAKPHETKDMKAPAAENEPKKRRNGNPAPVLPATPKEEPVPLVTAPAELTRTVTTTVTEDAAPLTPAQVAEKRRDLQARLVPIIMARGEQAVKEAFQFFGATKVSELPLERFGDLLARLGVEVR